MMRRQSRACAKNEKKLNVQNMAKARMLLQAIIR